MSTLSNAHDRHLQSECIPDKQSKRLIFCVHQDCNRTLDKYCEHFCYLSVHVCGVISIGIVKWVMAFGPDIYFGRQEKYLWVRCCLVCLWMHMKFDLNEHFSIISIFELCVRTVTVYLNSIRLNLKTPTDALVHRCIPHMIRMRSFMCLSASFTRTPCQCNLCVRVHVCVLSAQSISILHVHTYTTWLSLNCDSCDEYTIYWFEMVDIS